MFTWMWTKRFATMANRLQALEVTREDSVLSTDLSVQTLNSAPDYWERQQGAFSYLDRQINRVQRQTRTWGAMALVAVLADAVLVVAGLTAFQGYQQHQALNRVTTIAEAVQPVNQLETAIQTRMNAVMNGDLSPREERQIRDELSQLLRLQDIQGGPPLKADPANPLEAQAIAIRSLGLHGTPEAVAPLSRLLSNSNPIIRSGAAEALGQIGDQAAMDALHHALLGETNSDVRSEILYALHELMQPG